MTDNKKSRKIIFITLLFVLVLATAALVVTLAKYGTTDTVSDEANVAKFGLEIPNTINLFSDSYNEGAILSGDGTNIIAPGASGSYDFEVTGTSEVAYKVDATITLTYSDEWDNYEPILFSLDGETWTSFEVFQTSLKDALASETLAPGESYSSEQSLYWKWPFSTSSENDIKDTALGVAAAAATDSEDMPSVKVTIVMTSVQVE